MKYPWPCAGYGVPHGYAKGRPWFVCGRCRWNPGAPGNLPKEDRKPNK